jgi:hypothetical protein
VLLKEGGAYLKWKEYYFGVWYDTMLREEPLGVISHSRMSYHPYGSFPGSIDSVHISLAGTAGYCGAVGEVGVKEGVVKSKKRRLMEKVFSFIDDEGGFNKFRKRKVIISVEG